MIQITSKVLFFSLCLFQLLFAVPFIFNYQGVFLDSTGKAQSIKDSLRFTLYSSSSAPTSLWTETHFISSTNGIFSVNLGSKNKISPMILLNNDSLFIEISKGSARGNRLKINSTMYSIVSTYSDSARYADTAATAHHSAMAKLADSSYACQRAQTALIADSALKSHSNSFWEQTGTAIHYVSGNVAIGTDSAKEKLTLRGNILAENPAGDVNLVLSASANPAISLRQKNGAVSLDRAKLVYSNNTLYLNLWDSTGVQEIPGVLMMRQKGIVLDAKGIVRSSGFMVDNITLNVPDYVFDPSYSLKSLEEIQAYIQQNHHLPGIPSADSIRVQGMDLVNMNLKLLEKIEELTLYTIKQDKAIKALEATLSEKKK